MMKKFFLAGTISLLTFTSSIVNTFASQTNGSQDLSGATAVPTSPYDSPVPITVTSPFHLGDADTIIRTVISKASLIFLFLVGAVFMAMLVYAGFLFIVDAGNEENAKKARGVITSAIIGLVIIGITGFILKAIEAIFGIDLRV